MRRNHGYETDGLSAVFAEYLVARALGLADGVRSSWDAHDLTLPDGTSTGTQASGYVLELQSHTTQ